MGDGSLAGALLESAWITARVAAGLGVVTVLAAMGMTHARAGAAARSAVRRRRAGAGPRAAAMLLAAAAAGAVTWWTRDQAIAWLPAVAQAALAAAAALCALAGSLIAAWAAWTLGPNLAVGAIVREQGGLVTTGPFALVRHPFYAALGLLGVGATLAFGSPAGAATFLLLWRPAAQWRAALEEEVLAEAWPAAWAEYAARTPRFVPRV